MKCRETRDLIEAQLDGAGDLSRDAVLDEHLSACRDCREYRDTLSATVQLVREVPRPKAPGGFAADVMSRLPAGRRSSFRLLRFAPLAAAAVLLVAAILIVDRDPPAPGSGEGFTVASGPPAESEKAGGDKTRARAAGERRMSPAREAPGSPDAEDAMGRLQEAEVSADTAIAPAGMRQPAKPMEPEDSPPPPGSPAGPRPDVDRRYILSGSSPDGVAGQIWAEIVNLRRSAGAMAGEEAPQRESIEPDAVGEPSRLYLCVTEDEMILIAGLVKQRPGALLRRTNGVPGGKDEGSRDADDARRRLRVEILLRK